MKSAKVLKDHKEKSLFGMKTEREIISSSMRMLFLKKQIILDLFHCVSWLILALLVLFLISLSLRGTTYHGDNERSLSGLCQPAGHQFSIRAKHSQAIAVW